jgi:ribosomal protein S27E
MEELNRIEHDDNTVTIYWRCPSCSHVQITSSRAAVQQSGRGK